MRTQEKTYTLQYWEDEGWLVGYLQEFPVVMSQGENLEDLIANIRDAYELVCEDAQSQTPDSHNTRTIAIQL